MNNITPNNIEVRKKWANKILTLFILSFTFVSFVIGTICAKYMWRIQVIGYDWKPSLDWNLCIPYIVFYGTSALILVIKFIVFDILDKVHNKGNTRLSILICSDILAIIMIVISVSILPFLVVPVHYDVKVHPAPIICSSLSIIFVVSICVLTFYKDK